jgi:hypothetical protein
VPHCRSLRYGPQRESFWLDSGDLVVPDIGLPSNTNWIAREGRLLNDTPIVPEKGQ